MPDGSNEVYNILWCKERHEKLDKRIDSLESKFWGIIILLITNLAGISVLLSKGA
jgi:hypothetical protein